MPTTQRIRPLSSLFRQGLLGSIVFITIVFVVLYFLTVPNGPWTLVLSLQVVAMVVVGLAAWGYFSATIWVSPTEVSERGFFGTRRRFPVAEIDSILLATTAGSGGELQRQVFIRDAAGRLLVRMRGQFWSPESMDAVVTTLPVPVVKIDEVTTIKELRQQYPQLLFWFERRPVLALAVTAGVSLLIGVVLFVFLRGIGAA